MKKYIYNEESGELEEYKIKTTSDYQFCIATVNEDGDGPLTDLIGTSPLVFKSSKELLEYLSSKAGKNDLIEWLASGNNVVISQADIFVD